MSLKCGDCLMDFRVIHTYSNYNLASCCAALVGVVRIGSLRRLRRLILAEQPGPESTARCVGFGMVSGGDFAWAGIRRGVGANHRAGNADTLKTLLGRRRRLFRL